MSRVYFVDAVEEVELRGSERAHMGVTVDEFAFGLLDGTRRSGSKYDKDVRTVMTDKTRAQWDGGYGRMNHTESLRIFMSGISWGEDRLFTDGTVEDSAWRIALNTVHAAGSDPMKLFARLHAQCEIHCWWEGKDRAWIAKIMEDGRRIGLYRDDQGWDEVIDFVKRRDDSPVVTSYSVCDEFPEAGLVVEQGLLELPDDPNYPGEKDWDHWYELSNEERWDLGMKALRKQEKAPEGRVQITRRTWATYHHGYGLNVFKLNNAMGYGDEA